MARYSWVILTLALAAGAAWAGLEAVPSGAVADRFTELPVDMAKGELLLTPPPDIFVKSRGLDLSLSRTYKSRREATNLFGYGWSWSHGERLNIVSNSSLYYIEYVSSDTDSFIRVYRDIGIVYDQIARYATSVNGYGSWLNPNGAKGAPDVAGGMTKVAGTEGKSDPGVFEVDGWNFPTIANSTISKVYLSCYAGGIVNRAATVILHQKGFSNRSVTWNGYDYDCYTADITGNDASWTWADVNNIDAVVYRYKGTQQTPAYLDAFQVAVVYAKSSGTGAFIYPPNCPFTVTLPSSSRVLLTFRNKQQMLFDNNGRLLKKSDANGNSLYFSYSGNMPTCISNVLGNRLSFQCGGGRVTNITDHTGRSCVYTYDANGNLVRFVGLGVTNTFEYALAGSAQVNLRHNITKLIDTANRTNTVTYATNGTDKIAGIVDPAGRDIRFETFDRTTYSYIPGMDSFQALGFTLSNDISSVKIRSGRLAEAGAAGMALSQFTNASAISCAAGRSNQAVNALGKEDGVYMTVTNMAPGEKLTAGVWNFISPAFSSVVTKVSIGVLASAPTNIRMRVEGWDGFLAISSTSMTWKVLDITDQTNLSVWGWDDIAGLRIVLTNTSASAKTITIDAFKVMIEYEPDVNNEQAEDKYYYYDNQHNLLSWRRNGHWDAYGYDTNYNVTSMVNSAGAKWAYEYHPDFNKPTKAVDPNGNVTISSYDTKGNLLTTVDALGKTTTYTYDSYGNLIGITDPLGHILEFFHDAQGVFIASNKNKEGFITSYAYDLMGNVTRKTDPDGYSVSNAYNDRGLQVREYDQTGREAVSLYNSMGLVTNLTIAGANSIGYRYDILGRQIEQVDSAGNSEYYFYDILGNKTAKVDRLANMTVYRYDLYGRAIEEVDPLGATNRYVYDGDGNVVAKYDRLNRLTASTYDHNGQVLTMADALGNQAANTYDANGNKTLERVQAVKCPSCSESETAGDLAVAYVYNALNKVIQKITGAGRTDAKVTTIEYDDLGRATVETDPAGTTTRRQYDRMDRVTNIAVYSAGGQLLSRAATDYNRRGLVARERVYFTEDDFYEKAYAYDGRGLKVSETNASGGVLSIGYDQFSQPLTNTMTDGGTRTFEYDVSGNKIRETDPRGVVTTYAYDEANRLVSKTTGVTRAYSYEYDALGRVLREIDPLGHTAQSAYDAEGNLIRQIDKRGSTNYFAYDALNRVVEARDPMGNTARKEYDGRGNVWRDMSPMGGTNRFVFNAYGQIVKATDAGHNISVFEYNLLGQKIREINPRGLATAYVYDGLGRLIGKTAGEGLPEAQTNAYVYDLMGRVVQETDSLGHSSSISYDASGQAHHIVDRLGNETWIHHNTMGLATNSVDAMGHTTHQTYDAMGNLVRVVDKRTHATQLAYNEFGQKSAVTNALGASLQYTYDSLGRETRVTDSLGGYEQVAYDANGNVLSRRDKRGSTTVFIYDPLNRVIEAYDALSNRTAKTYDAAGNVLTMIDKRQATTTYAYDILGRVTQVTDDSGHSVHYKYDAAGNKIEETDPAGLKTTYEYDLFNRPIKKTVGTGSREPRVFEFVYDEAGRLAQEIDPLGYAQQYTYDDNGNKTAVQDRRGYETHFEYDGLGRLTRTIDATGHAMTQVYDPMNNVIETVDRRGNRSIIRYDEIGRVVETVDAKAYTNRFTYDAVNNRLTETDPLGAVTRYQYDVGGLVTNKAVGEGLPDRRVLSFEYDALGRVVRSVDPLGDYTVTEYDPNNNVVTTRLYSAQGGTLLKTVSQSFNNLNLLTEKKDPKGQSYRYEYDDRGMKIAEVDPLENRIEYEYDLFGNPIAVTDQRGNITRQVYDRRNQTIKTVNAAGFQTTYTYDENGNQIKVTDDNGNSIITVYDPLNRVTEVNKSMVDLPTPLFKKADINGDGIVDTNDVEAFSAP